MFEQAPRWTGLTRLWAGMTLSRVQSLVATLAGIVSISGALLSVPPLARAFSTGQLVATVQDASSHRVLGDATIEVLTPDDHIVATLTPDASGHAARELKDGAYVVRISRPGYASEVRHVQIAARQAVEVRAALHATPPPASADRVVSSGLRAVRKALRF